MDFCFKCTRYKTTVKLGKSNNLKQASAIYANVVPTYVKRSHIDKSQENSQTTDFTNHNGEW